MSRLEVQSGALHLSRGSGLTVASAGGGGGGPDPLPEGLVLALSTVDVGDLPATLTGLANNTELGDWPDGSGANNDAYNPDLGLSNRPRYRDNIYAFPVVRFDAINDYLRTPLAIASGALTVMVAYACHTSGGSQRLVSGSTNWFVGPWGGRYRYHAVGNWIANGGSETEPAVTNGDFVVQTAMQDNAQADHYLDGAVVGENIAPGGYPGTINLGGYGAFAEPTASDVAAVLIWNRLLDTEEREAAEALVAAALA